METTSLNNINMNLVLQYTPALYQTVWSFILCTFSIAFIVRGDLTHFTWWTLLFFCFYSFSAIFLRETKLFWFFATIENIVIGGVCLMSFSECQLFKNSEHDAGNTVYFFGNFAMHYFPLLAAIAFTRDVLIESQYLYRDINDIWTAFGVMMIYFSIYNPANVYACDLSKGVLLCGALVATMLTTLLRCLPILLYYT